MFDAKKLLDALVGAAANRGQQSGQPQAPSTGQPPQLSSAPAGSPSIADQVDQTLRQVTGQGTGQLVQKAKDVMAQNPGLAPAVMVALAGLFTGKRKSRGLPGGGLVKLGGLALIGTLAYKAFQNRQAGKPLLDVAGLAGALGGGSPAPGGTAPAPSTPAVGLSQEVPDHSVFHPVSQTDDDALLYLRAMVAAASADGQIDAAERGRILKGLGEAGIDPEATRWLDREMAAPADTEELSANVNTPEKAAQVYAAARIAIDPDTLQEREFLRQLAESLDLDPAVRAQIDETADAAMVGG